MLSLTSEPTLRAGKGGSGGMSQAVGNTGGLSTVTVDAAREHIKESLQSAGSR